MMYGLYVNVKPSHGVIIAGEYSYNRWESIVDRGNVLDVVYDSREWLSPPVFKADNLTIIVAGWFVAGEEKNNLLNLKRLIELHGKGFTEHITEGVYSIYVSTAQECYFISDRLSLFGQYYRKNNDLLEISPSLIEFEGVEKDSSLLQAMEDQGHLFGKYTIFQGVFKLDPLLGLDFERKETFKSYDGIGKPLPSIGSIPEYMSSIAEYWPKKHRHVALSAGFDSRLIMLSAKPNTTYTWGPRNSFDVKVAGKISNLCDTSNNSFDFSLDYSQKDREIYDFYVLDATSQKKELISNYRIASKKVVGSYVSFDGYLGDVLQRKTYHHCKSLKGEVRKFFPSTIYKTSSQELMENKYSSLLKYKKVFKLLQEDYFVFIERFSLKDSVGSFALYEYMQGRGGRHISCEVC